MHALQSIALALIGGWIWVVSSQSAAQSNAAEPAAARSEIHCSGVVVDEAGVPVSGAEVFFCSTPWTWVGARANPWPVAMMTSSSDAEGRFEFSFRRDDRRFLFSQDATLVVQKPGFAQVTQRVHYFRLLTDLPLLITLPLSSEREVQVVDHRGQPVAGARVCVCTNGGAATPLEVAERIESMTTAEGTAVVAGLANPSVPLLFVRSPDMGNQCVRCQLEGGRWIARLRETFDRELQIELPADAACDRLGEIEVQAIIALSDSSLSIEAPIEYAWSSAAANPAGRIRLPKIARGTTAMLDIRVPDELALKPNRRLMAEDWAANSNEPAVVPFRRAIPVKGRVVSSSDGRPLPNLVVTARQADFLTATDKDGGYALSIAEGYVLDYTVWDPFGDYLKPSAFGFRLTGLVGAESIEEKTIAMLPCLPLRGTVSGRDGNAIAGAIIDCQKKAEGYVFPVGRFTTDAQGEYTIRGVAAGDVIELTAATDRLATVESKTVSISEQANLDLVVEPADFARFAGKVVDAAGEPIPAAIVELNRAHIMEPEGADLEQTRLEPLFADDQSIITNESGEFLSPRLIGWRTRVQVKVRAAGFVDYCSPWIEPREGASRGESIELPPSVLTRDPAARPTVVSVADAEGNPLAGAQVVLVGAFTGVARASPTRRARHRWASRTVGKSSPSRPPTCGTTFRASTRSKLRSRYASARPGRNPKRDDRRVSIRSTNAERSPRNRLRAFDDLSMTESSVFRVRMLLGLQAVADPGNFRGWMKPESGLQDAIQNGELAIMILSDPTNRDSSQFTRLHDRLILRQGAADQDPQMRLLIEIEQARSLRESDERLECLSELLIRCRQSDGADRTCALAQLAVCPMAAWTPRRGAERAPRSA